MIRKIISEGIDSNVYIIIGDKARIVIDTSTGENPIIIRKIKQVINPEEIDIVINTHSHIDHCGGNYLFKNAKILIHEFDYEEMKRGTYYNTSGFILRVRNYEAEKIKDGEIIDIGNYVFKVIHTPGHTRGSICLYEEEKKILFTGDLIFADGLFGRTDLGGDEEDMRKSLEKICSLDVEKIYPGHGICVEEGADKHIRKALRNFYEIFGI